MKKIVKATAVTLAALTVLSSTAFAAALPLRETFEKSGFTVTWNQETKTVTISKDGFSYSEQVGENITLDYDTTYVTEEFVSSVYENYTRESFSTKATVKEVGEGYFLADTEKLGEVVFTVDESTHFHHEVNRMLYTFADVQVGASVKVYFSEAMTASLPPQTYAKEVVFLNTEAKEETSEGKVAVSELSQVFTVTEKGEGYILATNETMGEVMFKVDEATSFRHERNRRLYTLADVEVGSNLQITFSEAMTASLPPQTYATDVVFLDTAEADVECAETLTTSGKITAIGEEYFVIEKEDGSRVRFNVGEETNIHHVMNRRFYTFADLEEGMEVDVNHADAMTYSLPPQAAAIEVIIK